MVVALLAMALTGVAVGALLATSSSASLSTDPAALARVSLPLGGGKIERVSVHGRHDRLIPVDLRAGRIWPRRLIAAHEALSIEVTVKRPGWIAWLAGAEDRLTMHLRAPSAALRQHYLTLHSGQSLRLLFNRPVQSLSYGPAGMLRRHVLSSPQTSIVLPRTAEAGTISVAAAPRPWESAKAVAVSWFPAGAAAAAVAEPSPGTAIGPRTPISLTFSTPVSQALGTSRPPVAPTTAGAWHVVNTHTIQFRPTGYGYGLASTVTVGLPSGIRLVGARAGRASGSWSVPPGTTLRMHQILAELGYLPLSFRPDGPEVPADATAQQTAAIHPPSGSFSWRYSNTPSSLRSFWSPTAQSVITRGALMAFQNDHGLSPDGSPGPSVWKALIAAAAQPKPSSFGYTYVMVSEGAQHLSLWHSGRTVLTTAVNTGIASAPTATGTYPVFEHIPSGTMSGTNPDGSHYDDPGITSISYFNGGDALHAFTRAQYGFPQSLGCVEMATGPAAAVYPYTPIGTLVHVE